MDYKGILSRIKPSEAEVASLEKTRDLIIKEISQAAKKELIPVEVVAGGSTAKGTYLKGDFDIDLFVRFKEPTRDMSDLLELMLASVATKHKIMIERIHGSRDYFTFPYKGFFFEVVPVKYIDQADEADNVTDMSPLHVEWIQEHLSEKLQDDIRLAKQFCKAALVYGAESFINGVSGHVLDILLSHYKNFDSFVKHAANWSGVTVIDSQEAHDDVFKSLNQSKLVSPLIVVDPVDVHRNAAAALSSEKYEALITAAKEFEKHPSEKFFIIPTFDVKKLEKEKQDNESLFVATVSPKIGKKDVVATKVLKVFEFIERHLQLHDFQVRDANWFYGEDDCQLYYFVENKDLERTVDRQGPPLHLKDDVKRFQESHPDWYEKDDRLYAPVQREFTNPFLCFDHLLHTEFVEERVAKVSTQRYD